MGVTKEQFSTGIIKYLDNFVIPVLPTSGKWVVGSAAALMDVNSIFNSLQSNPLIRPLNVISDEGLIDVDRLATALKASAEKYGSLQLQIPFVGNLAFNGDDIEKMRNCINGGLQL